jgi:hypothetical protein
MEKKSTEECDYMSKSGYREEDEEFIALQLIYDLKPDIALCLLPELPACVSDTHISQLMMKSVCHC